MIDISVQKVQFLLDIFFQLTTLGWPTTFLFSSSSLLFLVSLSNTLWFARSHHKISSTTNSCELIPRMTMMGYSLHLDRESGLLSGGYTIHTSNQLINTAVEELSLTYG